MRVVRGGAAGAGFRRRAGIPERAAVQPRREAERAGTLAHRGEGPVQRGARALGTSGVGVEEDGGRALVGGGLPHGVEPVGEVGAEEDDVHAGGVETHLGEGPGDGLDLEPVGLGERAEALGEEGAGCAGAADDEDPPGHAVPPRVVAGRPIVLPRAGRCHQIRFRGVGRRGRRAPARASGRARMVDSSPRAALSVRRPRGREPPRRETDMLSENHERLLDYLSTADRWVEAGELADRLGVTTRSVRTYVQAVRERSAVSIASSPTAIGSTPAATPATSGRARPATRRARPATGCTRSSAASATRPTASTSSRSRASCT
ncbi:hypothetical protein BC477_04510 [Clavibacter michiganensis subsp. michiganensis]|uniref:Uncharacterized protein n=1 Tax=Clavibacter michiganensis subsp. michiganensis TaxID=33013 RepID=A0A251XKF8_CLAMM|nr:hypothetical protein BC477_04510 [Clavibacter michiganensis subsp. michiganensis]OUE03975.1 hypothetical protein CMMCAS07_03440 [Clavibacter michiganensis subsp. michiganensis]